MDKRSANGNSFSPDAPSKDIAWRAIVERKASLLLCVLGFASLIVTTSTAHGGDWAGFFFINEIHAYVGAEHGDANGDGVVGVNDDEFIEIVNYSGEYLDISNLVLSDLVGVRHVFPEGTVLGHSCAVVVFGGGEPQGDFGGAIVQVASTGALELNNSGDSIFIRNESGITLASATYGVVANHSGQSLTFFPDITGGPSYVLHLTASGDTLRFSPGYKVNGSVLCGPVFGDGFEVGEEP